MCGITGLINKNSGNVSENRDLLQVLSQAIIHRGPDDYAEYVDNSAGLAIRRLAIQDLTLGLYPFKSSDGNLVLFLNGEIYNFPELKNELSQLGYKFKTNCDAEAILYGYQKWGNAVFKKLRGMFAISIWNVSEKKLTLVRDRIGIKPIYYYESSDSFLFSSEAKSIIKAIPNQVGIDYENLEILLGFMFLPKTEETIIKGIKKLAPATILEIQGDKKTFSKYWDISDTNENTTISFNDALNELDDLLVETVRMHLLSDAPLGVMLSGGVDSSLIAAIMTKKGLQNKITTFTAKFDHQFDESALAKNTAEYLGTYHSELLIDTKQINANIENYMETFDDLTTFDGGILTTKALCAEVEKTGIKVLLLGEGADEIFGGYSWYSLAQVPLKYLPSVIRNSMYYYSISRNITVNPMYYAKFWQNIFPNSSDVFRDITRRELLFQLPNHLLMKVDKGSMASSIEARVPYLDHKLVEFVYSLPQSYKLKGDLVNLKKPNEKFILRELSKRYLPQTTAVRKKRGFMMPMNDVIQSDINKVKDYVLSGSAVSSNILSKNIRENYFKNSVNKFIQMQNEYFIWRLFILEVWAKKLKLK